MENAAQQSPKPLIPTPLIPTSLSFARTFAPKTMADLRIAKPIMGLIENLVSGNYPIHVRNSIILKLPKGRGKTSLCSIIYRMALAEGIHTYLVDINTLTLSNSVFDGIIAHAKSASVKYKLVILDNLDVCDNDSQNNISRFIDTFEKTIFISTATICYNMDESLRTKSNIASVPNYTMVESREILDGMIGTMLGRKHNNISSVAMDNIIDKCDHNMRAMINYMETLYLYGMTSDRPVDDATINVITDVNMDDSIGDLLTCMRGDMFSESVDIIGGMTMRGKSNIDILFAIFGYIVKHPVLSDVENTRLTRIIGKYIVVLNSCDDSLYMNFIVNDMMKVLSLE